MEHLNYQYPVRLLLNLIFINSILLFDNLAQKTREEEKKSMTNKQDEDDTDDENFGQSKSAFFCRIVFFSIQEVF